MGDRPRITFKRQYEYSNSGYLIVCYQEHTRNVHRGPFFEWRVKRAARKLVARHRYVTWLEQGDIRAARRRSTEERKQSKADLEALLDELQ